MKLNVINENGKTKMFCADQFNMKWKVSSTLAKGLPAQSSPAEGSLIQTSV